MLTRKQIVDEVIERVSRAIWDYNPARRKRDHVVYDVRSDETNFATEFKVAGADKWRFGVWMYDKTTPPEEGSIERVKFVMFGQHESYIDKFKPSRSPIRFEAEMDKNNPHIYIPVLIDEDGEEWRIYPPGVDDFAHAVCDCVESPTGARFKYYWDYLHGNPIKWLVSSWLRHTIHYPVEDFFRNEVLFARLHVRRVLHTMLFGHWLAILDVTDRGEGTGPRYDYWVVLKQGVSDEAAWRIYHLITPLGWRDNVSYTFSWIDDDGETLNGLEYEHDVVENEYRRRRQNWRDECYGLGRVRRAWANIKYAVDYCLLSVRYVFE